MSAALEKEEAHKLIDSLPEGATWDDLIRTIYVRQAVRKGLDDVDAGRTMEIDAVRAKLGVAD